MSFCASSVDFISSYSLRMRRMGGRILPSFLGATKTLIKRLSDCEYISDCHNIFITGATGSGKSYLACALSMKHKAWMDFRSSP